MSEPNMDPGPLPAVVEPEPAELTLVISVQRGWQVGVTRLPGLVGLTLRALGAQLTMPLAGFQVDELIRLLREAHPEGSDHYARDDDDQGGGPGRQRRGARFGDAP